MCAALTLDRLAHRGICRPLHPTHQTRGCSLWRSENRDGMSLNKELYVGYCCSVSVLAEEEEKVLQKMFKKYLEERIFRVISAY